MCLMGVDVLAFTFCTQSKAGVHQKAQHKQMGLGWEGRVLVRWERQQRRQRFGADLPQACVPCRQPLPGPLNPCSPAPDMPSTSSMMSSCLCVPGPAARPPSPAEGPSTADPKAENSVSLLAISLIMLELLPAMPAVICLTGAGSAK